MNLVFQLTALEMHCETQGILEILSPDDIDFRTDDQPIQTLADAMKLRMPALFVQHAPREMNDLQKNYALEIAHQVCNLVNRYPARRNLSPLIKFSVCSCLCFFYYVKLTD